MLDPEIANRWVHEYADHPKPVTFDTWNYWNDMRRAMHGSSYAIKDNPAKSVESESIIGDLIGFFAAFGVLTLTALLIYAVVLAFV